MNTVLGKIYSPRTDCIAPDSINPKVTTRIKNVSGISNGRNSIASMQSKSSTASNVELPTRHSSSGGHKISYSRRMQQLSDFKQPNQIFLSRNNNNNNFESSIKQARHVLQELIDSELSYVKQLQMISTGYIAQFDKVPVEGDDSSFPKVTIRDSKIEQQQKILMDRSKAITMPDHQDQNTNISSTFALPSMPIHDKGKIIAMPDVQITTNPTTGTCQNGISQKVTISRSKNHTSPNNKYDMPLPSRLKDKKNDIFSTWPEIEQFHKKKLMPVLHSYLENSEHHQQTSFQDAPRKNSITVKSENRVSSEESAIMSEGDHFSSFLPKLRPKKVPFITTSQASRESAFSVQPEETSNSRHSSGIHEPSNSEISHSDCSSSECGGSQLGHGSAPGSPKLPIKNQNVNDQNHRPVIEDLMKKNFKTNFKDFASIILFLNNLFSDSHINELEDHYFWYSQNLKKAFKIIAEAENSSSSSNNNSADGNSTKKYFQYIQSKFRHPLPLDAYLLIPVQRIGKYPLLLTKILTIYRNYIYTELDSVLTENAETDNNNDKQKEEYCEQDYLYCLIKSTQQRISDSMSNVNTRLHTSAINLETFPPDIQEILSEERIYHQALVSVQTEKINNRINSENGDPIPPSASATRTLKISKPRQRRVFLSDKLLIMTKERDLKDGKFNEEDEMNEQVISHNRMSELTEHKETPSSSVSNRSSSQSRISNHHHHHLEHLSNSVIPGATVNYEYKDFCDLKLIDGYPSSLVKRLTISLNSIRYYFTFENSKELKKFDNMLRIRMDLRKKEATEITRGPPILPNAKFHKKLETKNTPFSSFKRVLTRTSLRRKKSVLSVASSSMSQQQNSLVGDGIVSKDIASNLQLSRQRKASLKDRMMQNQSSSRNTSINFSQTKPQTTAQITALLNEKSINRQKNKSFGHLTDQNNFIRSQSTRYRTRSRDEFYEQLLIHQTDNLEPVKISSSGSKKQNSSLKSRISKQKSQNQSQNQHQNKNKNQLRKNLDEVTAMSFIEHHQQKISDRQSQLIKFERSNSLHRRGKHHKILVSNSVPMGGEESQKNYKGSNQKFLIQISESQGM